MLTQDRWSAFYLYFLFLFFPKHLSLPYSQCLRRRVIQYCNSQTYLVDAYRCQHAKSLVFIKAVQLFGWLFFLFGGTVPPADLLFGGTVPPHNLLFGAIRRESPSEEFVINYCQFLLNKHIFFPRKRILTNKKNLDAGGDYKLTFFTRLITFTMTSEFLLTSPFFR